VVGQSNCCGLNDENRREGKVIRIPQLKINKEEGKVKVGEPLGNHGN